MSFGEKILDYKEDIIKDLAKLVEIKSVSAQGKEEPQRALDFVLKRAEEMGLIVKNVDNIAGHAQLGTEGKLCGVLTHLDVVPAGEGWSVPPFELTRKNGRIYGRGIADDKGSAIIALYCMKALKDNNVNVKNTLRVIFGTTEETGMEDMNAYFNKEPIPDYSFTPDSDYGICNCEKGILQIELTGESNSTTLTKFKGGNAVNAVPDVARVLLDCSENDDHQLLRFADAKDGEYEFKYTIDGVLIESKGKAAHAMEPQKGFNAITHLIDLLTSNFSHAALGNVCAFIDSAIGLECNGNSLGIKMRDSASGDLTLNVGTVDIDESRARCTIDIRYPVTMDSSRIIERVKRAANQEGLEFNILSHLRPLNVSEDSEIISILKAAYKEVKGEEPKLYSTGGGTYARTLGGNGVAFGPVFPDDYSNMHKPDESLNEEKFFEHGKICLEAMYKLIVG